jgi:hypothetical protein
MHVEDGVKELLPSERNAVLSIKHQLMSELAYRPATMLFTEDTMKRQFEERARNRCGEIGFVISVQWTWDDPDDPDSFSPTVSDNPEDTGIYWLPKLVIEGRIDKLHEVDHDELKHEIVTGVADGQSGFIREDGTKHEEPIKKQIL